MVKQKKNTGSSASTIHFILLFPKDRHNGKSVKINLTTILHKNTTRDLVNSIPTNALVDTGADISCISQSFLNKIFMSKPNLKKTHVYSVLGIGQQKLRVLGKVFLTTKIKDKCFEFDFHVIDTLPHSLIGVDFLETHNVTIDLFRKSMEISDKCAKICSLETNLGFARCIKSCALPANSEIVLPVHVSRRIQGEQVLYKPVSPNAWHFGVVAY
ncbi:unnamed protein product [Mytilus edulis]|uniref:Peptidase A2 domain-containing protein n=1 Tax=Mytilus edulis TaxID=6550 RepID=A0A8S3UDY0_MYTED|nr:unnamed protein product [Mytilus edulis]